MVSADCANDPPKKRKKRTIPPDRKADGSPLSLREKRFVEYYLGEAKGLAGQAARLAGFAGNNVALRKRGSRILKRPLVKKLVDEHVKRLALQTEDVLERLSKIAASEFDQFVKVRLNGKGEVIDAKIELRDVVRSLELLGKYHKLFEARDGAISLVQFRQMSSQMGAAVVDAVNELSLDEETANQLLESVERRWKGITSGTPGGGGTPEP